MPPRSTASFAAAALVLLATAASGPGEPVAEGRAPTPAELVPAVEAAFPRESYAPGETARLERAIGLSRGAIFNYFPSKEDLFVELAVRDSARMSEL